MKSYSASQFLLVFLLFFNDFIVGRAAIQRVHRRRGLKGSSIQRTTLAESDSDRRGLQDELPCTHYYKEKKSKFNKYDDDWYTPCKSVENEHPTTSPSGSPSPREPKTKQPSAFFSPTSPATEWLQNSSLHSLPPLAVETEGVSPKPDKPVVESVNEANAANATNAANAANTTDITSESSSNDDPLPAPSKTPVESEETTEETQIDINIPISGKGTSCLKAKAGQIFPSSVNFTIHYKYELLAEQEANLTGEVWPEIDRAFQRFLALTMIDCDIDVRSNGASKTIKGRLQSISPEPIDSVGSLYPNGWSRNGSAASDASSCTKIQMDDAILADRGLYCDVVTGSITLYLSEVSYTDTASNPLLLFHEYRDEVFQFLRDEINDGGDAISNYFDTSLGIKGFYFLSEATNLNLRPISIPDAASDESNPFGPSLGNSSTTAIAGSLISLAALTIAAAAFVFHRRKKDLDHIDDTFKLNKTPRMDDNEMEFYDLDGSNHGSADGAAIERSNSVCRKMFFPVPGNVLNDSNESRGDIPPSPRSDIDATNDHNEKSSQYSESYDYSHVGADYSHVGVSMRLHSPDKDLSTHFTRERPDPSIVGGNLVERKYSMDPDKDEENQGDKSSAPIRLSVGSRSTSGSSVPTRLSIGSRSTSQASVSSSKYVDSVKGSPALEYILALGSAYQTSNKPFDEESVASNKNDNESLNSETSSINTQGAKLSPSPEIGKTGISPGVSQNKKYSRDKRNSPNSVAGFSIGKSPPPLSSFDDGSSIQSPMSSATEGSNNSRVEYLRNRRKDLENRFQNYRRSLSESMDNISKSHSTSWLTSREFSRSVSIYKNSDESFSSPGVSSSDAPLGGGTKSTTPDSVEEGERSFGDSDSVRKTGKQRSRVDKYDFEEILDNDDAWGIEPPGEDNEKPDVDNFLSSCSIKSTPPSDPTRFQANTVIF